MNAQRSSRRNFALFLVAALLSTMALLSATARAAVEPATPARPIVQSDADAGTTVYLPNVVKMLGGPDGWQSPFIVQNVGSVPTDVRMEFYAFTGELVKVRTVTAMAPGTSTFHDPNSDRELAPGGQFSVVIRSTSAPVVAVVNEHQSVTNPARQEALSYSGFSRGSTRVFLPYTAYLVNGWVTTMIIQNLGQATANVTLKFVNFDGSKTVTLARTIAAGRSQFVDPRVEPTLTPGNEYAVSVSSDQPVGVVVNAHNDAPGTPAPMGLSYNGVLPIEDDHTFVPYATRNADGISRSSRLIVQNIGSNPATPSLFFRGFGQTHAFELSGPAIQPGASWSMDLRQSPLPDGEYGVHITGGQFGVLSATTSPTTAIGVTNYSGSSSQFFLPNITRTLGGPNGWTTPILIQPTCECVSTARLSWYRFSDGALVTTQSLTGLSYASTFRVDPRTVPGLLDDTQYAVMVETPLEGAAVTVLELSFNGGAGAMAYSGFEPPASAPFGTSNCSPSPAAAGSTFICRFYGLTPGATPVTYSETNAQGPLAPDTYQDVVPVDGSWTLYTLGQIVGLHTVTATAGGKSATATYAVTIPTFAVAVTKATNGQISAQTRPLLPCTAVLMTSDRKFVIPPGLGSTETADPNGNVFWSFTPVTSPSGQGAAFVRCTSGHQTLIVAARLSIP